MTLEEIIGSKAAQPRAAMSALKDKSVPVPAWGGAKGLMREYEPKYHPVMNKALYPDISHKNGSLEKVTRISLDFQRLAVRRMSELVCGVPVKRVYKPETDRQKEAAAWLERIYQRNRIDSVNIERTNMLYAGCEVLTLWYAVEQPNTLYGLPSPIKLRCRNFSPMLGDELYPYFDEYGDLVALSIAYRRKRGDKTVSYFDVYTDEEHWKWSTAGGDWAVEEQDKTTVGKIPAVYMYRPTPVWEDTSDMVYEMEWALSRNGNYLRKNSKPLFVVFADEQVAYNQEKSQDKEFRSVLQYPAGSSAQYVTWPGAIDNLKFYVEELRNLYFTQLQLPDWSYEKMSQQALSGESRKQLFIDARLKVADESGRLLEFFDREMNVVKAFLKTIAGAGYENDIDELEVENIVTPYSVEDERETITNLTTANGGKPLMSQRESIEMLGWSSDVDRTMDEIEKESVKDVFEPYQ